MHRQKTWSWESTGNVALHGSFDFLALSKIAIKLKLAAGSILSLKFSSFEASADWTAAAEMQITGLPTALTNLLTF